MQKASEFIKSSVHLLVLFIQRDNYDSRTEKTWTDPQSVLADWKFILSIWQRIFQ